MKTASALPLLFLGAAAATATKEASSSSSPRRRLDWSSYGSMEGVVTDAGYDSYATAWRYLGAFFDCSTSISSTFSKYGSSSFQCKFCGNCKGGTRRLLWAAYRDPYYEGNQIGEYQYYDSDDGEWDDSTCTGDRCAKMDCHDPYGSDWELIGVYKETVSFQDDNFFEQLFKHQGYCLWDGDKEDYDYDSQDTDAWQDASSDYWFMQAMRKELPEGCTQVSDFYYSNGDKKRYYIDMKPQSKGDMTLGVYTDSKCSKEADYTYEDYQSAAASSLTATATSGAFDTWNSGMDAYKICQPCRAYNREETEYNGNGSHDWGRRNRDRRRTTEYNDGQGDEEENGFNCYDDAGYQNCNQCYKFETHTDMQVAYASDLAAADQQGTILKIQYEGTWYGSGTVGDVSGSSSSSSGGYGSASSGTSSYTFKYQRSSYSFAGAAAFLAVGGAAGVVRRRRRRRRSALEGDAEEDEGGDDAYVEMAAPR